MIRDRYLLDTNICIHFMKGCYDLDQKINDDTLPQLYISEITVAELLYGAALSINPQQVTRQVDKFVSNFKVIPIFSSLSDYANVKAQLRRAGTPIDDFDLLIGATALHNSMTLVTENVKHFKRIPNLKIENWIQR